MNAITRLLGHPKFPIYCALLALVLSLPSLWTGLQFDDFAHRSFFLNLDPTTRHTSRIFTAYGFIDGNPERNRVLMDQGVIPWWTPKDFRINFFRPLSSMSLWLDYRLWPDRPMLMHLHSILWYVALVAAASILYRRIMGATWVAGLASLLYAVERGHAAATAWLAGRNALIAAFLAIMCLLAYDVWRRDGKRWGAIVSPVCCALAILSGEMSLAVAGYLLAYGIFLDRDRPGRRFIALVPCFAVFFAWGICYLIFGFGAHGSGMYLDPLENLPEFARALVLRVPFFLLGQFTPLPAELGLKAAIGTALIVGFVMAAVLVFMLLPLARKDPITRFLILGMVFSLVPIASSDPSNRLLILTGVGAMGLIARFLGSLAGAEAGIPRARAWRIPALVLGWILIFFHLAISPISMPTIPRQMKLFANFMLSPIVAIPDDPQIRGMSLILANPPDYFFSAGQLIPVRIALGKSYPKRVRALSGGAGPVEISRLDQRSLRVKTPGGLFSGIFGYVYKTKHKPLAPGQEFNLPDLNVRIISVDKQHGPDEVIYRFSVPLEDPSLRWLRLEKSTYIPFVPPPVGGTVLLHGSDPMEIFMPKKDAGEIHKQNRNW